MEEWSLSQLSQYMTYGIFAMTLAFIWGQVGLLCFGHSLFFGLGAYMMAMSIKGMLPGLPASQLLGFVLAMLVPSLWAIIFGLALFKGKSLTGAYFGIVTLAAAIIAERIAVNWNYIGGFNGILDIPALILSFGQWSYEVSEPVPMYFTSLIFSIAVFALLFRLCRSPFGSLLRGIRDNDLRASFMGYDVPVIKTIAFAISGGLAGLAGALFTVQFYFVSPALVGFALSTEVLIWVALGGKEVILAAYLGAVIVKNVESFLSDTLGQFWLLVLGLLFTISVVFLPKGLLGGLLSLPLPRRLRRSPLAQKTK
jgi:branched-chain amino acid transport system permease protein/urea transport system permease protein